MEKILILSDSREDLLDRFKPLIDQIRKSISNAYLIGVFYFKNYNPQIIDNGGLFNELYFPTNKKKFYNIIKNQNADKILVFMSHTGAMNDVQIYLMTKFMRLKNVVFLRRNLHSLKEYLKTGNDEKNIISELMRKEVKKSIIIDIKIYSLFLLVFLFYCLGKFFFKFRHREKNKKHKILFIRLDMLGDVIITYPYIRALRDKYYNSELTILTSNKGQAFLAEQQNLEQTPIYDKLIVWEAPWHTKRFKLQNIIDLFKMLNILPKLWKEKYDLVIQPVVVSTGTAFAVLIFGKRIIAIVAEVYPLARLMKRYISVPVVIPNYKIYHLSEPLKYVIEKAGVDAKAVWNHIEISESNKNKIYIRLLKENYIRNRPVFIINIGAGHQLRRWSSQKFADLCNRIHKENNVDIIITGGKDEIPFANDVEKLSDSPMINLAGKLSLSEVAGLISISEIIITADTGIMHLAALVNARIVALFGAGLVTFCKPLCDNYVIVKHELGCSGCGDICFVNGIAPCMEAIKVEDVLFAINKLLNSSHIKID